MKGTKIKILDDLLEELIDSIYVDNVFLKDRMREPVSRDRLDLAHIMRVVIPTEFITNKTIREFKEYIMDRLPVYTDGLQYTKDFAIFTFVNKENLNE